MNETKSRVIIKKMKSPVFTCRQTEQRAISRPSFNMNGPQIAKTKTRLFSFIQVLFDYKETFQALPYFWKQIFNILFREHFQLLLEFGAQSLHLNISGHHLQH